MNTHLTAPQVTLLRQLADGWRLRSSTWAGFWRSRRGEAVVFVPEQTPRSLLSRGLLTVLHETSEITEYGLSETGVTAVSRTVGTT